MVEAQDLTAAEALAAKHISNVYQIMKEYWRQVVAALEHWLMDIQLQ
jgi:DNA-binding GntR family transcriptional regulator